MLGMKTFLDCWGIVLGALMVDTKTTLKENLEVGRVKVFLDRASSLPTVISLWVQDIRFPVEIVAEDQRAGIEKIFLKDLSYGALPVARVAKSWGKKMSPRNEKMTSLMRRAPKAQILDFPPSG